MLARLKGALPGKVQKRLCWICIVCFNKQTDCGIGEEVVMELVLCDSNACQLLRCRRGCAGFLLADSNADQTEVQEELHWKLKCLVQTQVKLASC